MEKMILVPVDQYQSLTEGNKKKATPESALKQSNEVPDDVKVALYQDGFIKKEAKRKNLQNADVENSIKRLKPILENSTRELDALISSFPIDQHGQVREILSILTHLPKVEVSSQQVKIDGNPMNESSSVIIKDMLNNNVEGASSVISHLRGQKKKKSQLKTSQTEKVPSPLKKTVDSATSYESFSKSLIPFLVDQSTPQRKSRSLEKTPTPKRRETTPSPYNNRLRTRKKNVSTNQPKWENY